MIRLAIALTGAVLIFLGAGCSLHQPQRIPVPVDIPAEFASPVTPAPPLAERWWTLLGDQRLDALMNEAFRANLDLDQAVARLRQLEATSRSVGAARRPRLDLQGQASRETTPSFFGDNEGDSYRLSLAAAFEVDLWDKLKSRRDAARFEAEASRSEVLSLYLRLSAQVADLYYLAAEQRHQLELTSQTIAAHSDTLRRVERRYREGLVPALDVYQARQNLSAAEAREPAFEAGLAQAEHALSVLLGRYPQRLDSAEVVSLQRIPDVFPAGLPTELLARRPDVKAAFLQVKASDKRIAATIADRFPSFNLAASYGEMNTAFSTGDITGTFWDFSASLLQPLIDGGRRRAEVDRSRAEFAERLAAYQKTALIAFQEVEDALVANRGTQQRISMLEDQVRSSQASLRLATDRYLQGLSDYLPVLTAQTRLFDAQSQLLSARRQLIVDRIDLARAVGGTWMETELSDRTSQRPTQGLNR